MFPNQSLCLVCILLASSKILEHYILFKNQVARQVWYIKRFFEGNLRCSVCNIPPFHPQATLDSLLHFLYVQLILGQITDILGEIIMEFLAMIIEKASNVYERFF